MVKSTLLSVLSSRGGRARGPETHVQDFEQVERHLQELNVYLETNMSDPYGEVPQSPARATIGSKPPSISSR